jgi:hypothetical protein
VKNGNLIKDVNDIAVMYNDADADMMRLIPQIVHAKDDASRSLIREKIKLILRTTTQKIDAVLLSSPKEPK